MLTLTVQTVPFQSFPVVHCDFGVRRWVSNSTTRLKGGETSVALLTEVPWLKGIHNSKSFQVAPVGWEYIPEDKRQDNDKFRLIWGSGLVPLLNELQFQYPLPEPQKILGSPETGMNLQGTPNVAIFYKTGMKPNHGVEKGLLPGDRYPLAQQLAEKLSSKLIFTDPLRRVEHPNLKKPSTSKKYHSRTSSKNIFSPSKSENPPGEPIFAERRRLIGQAVNKQLTIEIR